MRRISVLLLASILVALMLHSISPIVNNRSNPNSQQAQGWPMPAPLPKIVPTGQQLTAQGWPMPAPLPKIVPTGQQLMAQGWPMPAPLPKVWSAGEDLTAQA